VGAAVLLIMAFIILPILALIEVGASNSLRVKEASPFNFVPASFNLFSNASI
jgi:hypothetical protein